MNRDLRLEHQDTGARKYAYAFDYIHREYMWRAFQPFLPRHAGARALEMGCYRGEFTRTLATPDFPGFVQYVAEYVMAARPAATPWKLNDGIASGYGYGHLLAESESAEIPDRPKLSYTGLANHPVNALAFTTTPFSSKKGGAKFGAVQWRLADISPPVEPGARRRYELEPVWESAESAIFNAALRLPINLTKVGATYRLRVRLKDNAGRFSRWSEPIQFTATPPVGAPAK